MRFIYVFSNVEWELLAKAFKENSSVPIPFRKTFEEYLRKHSIDHAIENEDELGKITRFLQLSLNKASSTDQVNGKGNKQEINNKDDNQQRIRNLYQRLIWLLQKQQFDNSHKYLKSKDRIV